MNKNVGGSDRTVRLVLGSLLLVIGIAGYAGLVRLAVGPLPQALTAVVLAVVGLILLVTGLTRVCAINRLLGRNTSGQ
jgi:hypothetical protein